MVTEVGVLTVPAVMLNVAEVDPCAILTLEGMLAAAGLELAREMITPPLGAVPLKVAVPVPVWPLVIVLGLADTLLSAAGGGVIVKLDDVLLTPE